MSLPFFAGASAQSHADTMLKWRQIWGAEKQADRQYDLERERLEFARQDASDSREFQERLTQLQLDFQTGVIKRKELYDVSEIALGRMPNMTAEQQWATVEEFAALDSPLAGVMRNQVRDTLYTNFEDAANMVDRVFTAPVGEVINRPFAEMALETFITRTGMERGAADTLREQFATIMDQRAAQAEELDGIAIDGARTALSQARVNVAKTESETVVLDAQGADILHGIAVREEQRPAILESILTQNRIMALEESQLQIVNGNLPERLKTELRIMSAEATSIENGNEMFNRTIEYHVRNLAAETGMAEEQLRHNIATAMVRDAIVQGDLDHLRAVINYTNSQAGLTDATRDLTREQVEALGLDMRATKLEIASSLVENGMSEMLREVAPELLGDIIPEGGMGALVDRLTEIADSNMSHRNKMQAAYAATAIAEQHLAEFQAYDAPISATFERWSTMTQLRQGDRSLDQGDRTLDQQDDRLELDRDVHDDRVRLEEWGLTIREKEADAYITSLHMRDAPLLAGPLNPLDVHKDIKTATNLSVSDLNERRGDLQRIERSLGSFYETLTIDDEGNVRGVQDEAGLRALGAQFKIPDADVMDVNDLARVMDNYMRAERDTAESLALANTRSYINAWISQTGQYPTAQDLGMEGGDDIWRRAIATLPGFSLFESGIDVVTDSAYDRADQFADRGDPVFGASFGTVSEVYDDMTATFGEQAMHDANFYEPADLLPAFDRASQEYQQHFGLATEAAQLVSGMTGRAYDLESRAGLRDLEHDLQQTSNAMVGLREDLDALPNVWSSSAGFLFRGETPPNIQQNQQMFVVNFNRATGIGFEEMVGNGWIHEDGTIKDPSKFREFLTGMVGKVSNQRISVQILESR